MVRISLWLYGVCAIRSQPLGEKEAQERIAKWRDVYRSRADIRTEAAL